MSVFIMAILHTLSNSTNILIYITNRMKYIEKYIKPLF